MSNELIAQEQNPVSISPVNSSMGIMSTAQTFNDFARMADALSKSSIVPSNFQENPSNCLIALDTAARMNMSPMQVMQNLYIVNGRPAWSSQWIIAAINASRKYVVPLQFEVGHETEDGGLSCVAWTVDRLGNKVKGPKITLNMANAEGWTQKNGSKWKSMPEVMICYRAASFFGRMNCPDVTLGLYAEEEAMTIPQEGGTVNVNTEIPFTENVSTVPPVTETIENAEPAIVMASKTDILDIFDVAQKLYGKDNAKSGLMVYLNGTYGINKSSEIRKEWVDEIKAKLNEALETVSDAAIDEANEAIESEVPVNE